MVTKIKKFVYCIYYVFVFRYSGAKKYSEAIDLLYSGSQTLLQHKQVSWTQLELNTCTIQHFQIQFIYLFEV